MVGRYILVFVLLFSISQSQVVVLADENITEFMDSHKHVMIYFYTSTWCSRCKELILQVQKVPQLLNGLDVEIAKLDITFSLESSKKFNVEKIPALLFITNGAKVNFDGDVNAKDIAKWINTVLEAKIQTKTEEQIDDLIGSSKFIVLRTNNKETLNALAIASLSLGITCYHISSQDSKITLYDDTYQSFEWEEFQNNIDVTKLKTWITPYTLPILIPASNKFYSTYILNKYKGDMLLMIQGKDLSENIQQTLRDFCKNNLKVVKCLIVNQPDELYPGVVNFLKIQKDKKQTLAFLQAGFQQGQIYTQDLKSLTQQKIKDWIHNIKTGQQKDDGKQITYEQAITLTNSTFDQYIKENSYVFVQFYMSNCSKCKQFSTKYDNFAKQMHSKNSQYKIATVNAIYNPKLVKRYQLKQYPTFIFFIKGAVINYEGQTNTQAMQQFITQKVNTKLQIVKSIEEIKTPAVIIYDPSQKSQLATLALSFKRQKYPIYQIQQGDKIRVQVRGNKNMKQYRGEINVQKIRKWLYLTTAPIFIDFAQQQTDPVLFQALEDKIPLLILVQNSKMHRKRIEELAQKICRERKGTLLCGYSRTQAQQSHIKILMWLQQIDRSTDFIYYVDMSLEKPIFKHQTDKITYESVKTFIQQTQTKIKKIKQETLEKQQKKFEDSTQPEEAEKQQLQKEENINNSEL